MDAAKLRELLAVLSEAGVVRGKVPVGGGVLEVEFAESLEAATPFVDKDGNAPDLDKGASDLTRDPDADLETANFDKKKA